MSDAPTNNPLSKLSLHRQVGVIAAAALAVLCFLPWFKVEMFMAKVSTSASDNWRGIVCVILSGFTAAWYVSAGLRAALSPKIPPQLRASVPLITAGLALLIAPVWFLIDSGGPDVGDAPAEFRRTMSEMVKVHRTIWAWLALAAGIAATWAGWQERSTSSP